MEFPELQHTYIGSNPADGEYLSTMANAKKARTRGVPHEQRVRCNSTRSPSRVQCQRQPRATDWAPNRSNVQLQHRQMLGQRQPGQDKRPKSHSRPNQLAGPKPEATASNRLGAKPIERQGPNTVRCWARDNRAKTSVQNHIAGPTNSRVQSQRQQRATDWVPNRSNVKAPTPSGVGAKRQAIQKKTSQREVF